MDFRHSVYASLVLLSCICGLTRMLFICLVDLQEVTLLALEVPRCTSISLLLGGLGIVCCWALPSNINQLADVQGDFLWQLHDQKKSTAAAIMLWGPLKHILKHNIAAAQ